MYFHSLGLISSLCNNAGLFVIQASDSAASKAFEIEHISLFHPYTSLKYTNYVPDRTRLAFIIQPLQNSRLQERSCAHGRQGSEKVYSLLELFIQLKTYKFTEKSVCLATYWVGQIVHSGFSILWTSPL